MKGTTISHFTIVDELGAGGMGVVYKADDSKLERTVALKLLPAQALASETDRARFYQEARAAAALNHPNIATVYEIDEAEDSKGDSRPFIAMEFIEGESLAEQVARGPLALENAVTIAAQVAEGLKVAHDKGIVHRDIKAGNIMFNQRGRAKILDFGLAKTAEATRLTMQGMTLGTVAYMSPEQARGEEVDGRSDIFSLGVVLYEMVVGRPPFEGDRDEAIVYGILNQDAEPLIDVRSGVPDELNRITQKCLAKDANRRYQDAGDLAADLYSLSATTLTSTKNSGTARTQTGTSAAKRLSPALITGLLVTGLAAAAVGFSVSGGLDPGEQPTPDPTMTFEITIPIGLEPPNSPRISPDNRYLAYSATSPGGVDLYVHDFTTGETRVGPTFPWILLLNFSPDGRLIALTTRDAVYLVSSENLTSNHLIDAHLATVVWGEDGELYMANRDGFARLPINGDPPEIVVPVDSMHGRYAFYPARTPHPKKFFAAMGHTEFTPSADSMQMGVVDVEKGTVTIIREHGGAVAYLPSGHLLFVSGPYQWYLQRFNPETFEFIGARELVGEEYTPFRSSVNEHGTLVRFRHMNIPGAAEFAVLNDDGERVVLSDQNVFFYRFTASPDGSRIAGRSYPRRIPRGEPRIHRLHVLDASRITAGDAARTLSQWSSWDFPFPITNPIWSPDGKRLVWTAVARDWELNLPAVSQPEVLMHVRLSGSAAPETLFAFPDVDRNTALFQFTRDGSQILASHAQRVSLIDISTGEISHPFEFPGDHGFAGFSPDESQIVFAAHRESRASIHAFDRNSGEIYAVVDGFAAFQWMDEDTVLLNRVEDGEMVYYEQNIELTDRIRLIGEPTFVTSRFIFAGSASVNPQTGDILMARYARAHGKMEIRLNWDQEVLERLPVD